MAWQSSNNSNNRPLDFHEEAMSDISMSHRLTIDIVCPNNHNQTVTFTQEEFESTITSGGLEFHCNTCDTKWSPSAKEIVKIRKQLSEHSL